MNEELYPNVSFAEDSLRKNISINNSQKWEKILNEKFEKVNGFNFSIFNTNLNSRF